MGNYNGFLYKLIFKYIVNNIGWQMESIITFLILYCNKTRISTFNEFTIRNNTFLSFILIIELTACKIKIEMPI